MVFIDRVLTCIDCKAEFLFTAGERAFIQDKHFTNDPKHCKSCRAKRKGSIPGQIETAVTCAGCGENTTVPFKPTQGKPVFCRECFKRSEASKPVASSQGIG